MLSEVVSLPAHVVQYGPEIVDPPFEQGGACVCRHESRVPPGCASFPGTVPRIVVVCDGWVEAQREALSRFVVAEGFEIVGEFKEVETGKGADALDRRPQLAAALAEARRRKCPIVVAKLDRPLLAGARTVAISASISC